MKLFILLVIVAIIWVMRKNKVNSIAGLIDLVKKAFSSSDSKNTNQNNGLNMNSSVPNNVRRDIINQQYLFMYQDKQLPFDDAKKDDKHSDPVKKHDSHFEDEDRNIAGLNADTVLVDTNGEVHSLYDLSSAAVNQKESSQRTYSFKHDSQPKIRQKPRYRKNVQSTTPKQNKQVQAKKTKFVPKPKPQEKPKQKVVVETKQAPQAGHDYIDQVRARLKAVSKQK